MAITTVHLMRHGEVFNPDKILYGRIPGYHLSELGHLMAQRVADHLAAGDFDVTVVTASPLQRAQETATPIAAAFDLELGTDERLIEAGNYFEGKTFVLPATCEPEGYLAEKAKGHVRSLAGGQRAVFNVTTGYLSAEERRRLRDELGG